MTKRTIQIPIFFFSALLLGLPSSGAAQSEAAKDGKGVSAQSAFDMLKKLEGEWSGTIPGSSEAAHTVRFRMTAAGSALMETQFAGTGHEMINMYHRDGDDLRLTHYCAIGNQPQMKLQRALSKPGELVFDFVGGTNMDSGKDLHIHAARIMWAGDDRIESEWTSYAGKKQNESTKFILTRKKH